MSEKKKSFNKFYEMKVNKIMQTTTSELACVKENDDVAQVLSLLNKKDHVWVIDSKEPQQILGVITESDTITLLSPPVTSLQSFDKPDSRSLQYGVPLTAEEIMSKKPVTVTPDDNIIDVIVKMKQHHIKQLPVVDENERFLGEITLHRLIVEYSRR